MKITEVLFEGGIDEDGTSCMSLQIADGPIIEIETTNPAIMGYSQRRGNTMVIVPYHAVRFITVELEKGDKGYINV